MSRKSRIIIGLVALAFGAVFLAGYWPEHRQRVALQTELATLRTQLNESEARVRTARLLGQLLNVSEAVTALNYGQAQELSSKFFDAAGTEAARTPLPEFKTALENTLQLRDSITAALARGDQAAVESLRRIQGQLRGALGYLVGQAT